MSKSLGEHEVERPEYSVSRSVDHRNTSDRVNRTVERVVTPSEIQSFEELTGYVAFAGDHPIAKISMQYRTLPQRTEPFCERSEEHTSELQSLMRLSYAVLCLKKTQ